jgi:hypothetical protein
VGSLRFTAAVANGVHTVILGAVRNMRIVVSCCCQNSLLRDAYQLLIFVRPQRYCDQSDPRNSNAYAIGRKCKKKIECDGKSFQIMYLQFTNEVFAARGGANCVMRVTVEQLRLRR